jgi:beta-galactosidase
MSVLLRPGPYVCSEWDWGGIPARLFAIDDLKIRTANNLFIEETKIYFEQLYKVIKPYIKSPKIPDGPILMVQV